MPGKRPLRDAPTFAFRRSRKRAVGGHGDGISRSPEKRAVRMVVAIGGIVMFALAELLAALLAQIFTGYDAGLFALTVHAFRVYAFALCFMGISMYGSSLFTALGNGLVSALIAFTDWFTG